MKYFTLILLCLLTISSAKANETDFFESLYDIPMMVGLVEVKEDGISYDKMQGRLAFAKAFGRNIEQKQVLSFYRATLPQMGWREFAPLRFTREREILTISFEKSMVSGVSVTSVSFALSPLGR